MVTRMGEREIGAVSGRLTDNSGELACIIGGFNVRCVALYCAKRVFVNCVNCPDAQILF